MRNDEIMKGDSRGGQRYMIANRETMGVGRLDKLHLQMKVDSCFLFYKLNYCRYKTSKIHVLNLTFEILIK